MGMSIVLLAYDVNDAERVFDHFSWVMTDKAVPTNSPDPFDVIAHPEQQDVYSFHFSAGKTDKHLLIHVELSQLGPSLRPDFEALSVPAPVTVHTTADTSNFTSVERFENGVSVWTVWGVEQTEFGINGPVPIDTARLIRSYREWAKGLPKPPKLPDNDDLFLKERGDSIVESFAIEITGHNLLGQHAATFYRLEGTLPVAKLSKRGA